jgi:hypothetical protein
MASKAVPSIRRNMSWGGIAMNFEETKKNLDVKKTKKIIADTFKQLGLTDETYTGEVTVGLNNGGVLFIRKSETLK